MTMPSYRDEIVDDMRRRIREGDWPPGSKLPTTTELLEMYRELLGVKSISTVRSAVDYLKEQGELTARPGVAVYVARK